MVLVPGHLDLSFLRDFGQKFGLFLAISGGYSAPNAKIRSLLLLNLKSSFSESDLIFAFCIGKWPKLVHILDQNRAKRTRGRLLKESNSVAIQLKEMLCFDLSVHWMLMFKPIITQHAI